MLSDIINTIFREGFLKVSLHCGGNVRFSKAVGPFSSGQSVGK